MKILTALIVLSGLLLANGGTYKEENKKLNKMRGKLVKKLKTDKKFVPLKNNMIKADKARQEMMAGLVEDYKNAEGKEKKKAFRKNHKKLLKNKDYKKLQNTFLKAFNEREKYLISINADFKKQKELVMS